jgi:16S rRNA (uracil1498-N3)-methyltransferase
VRRRAAAQVLVVDPAEPVLDADARRHLARVLRLRTGEPVVATDGQGRWAPCRFRAGALEPEGAVSSEPKPSPLLTVAFVPAKGERPERVVQKLTEVGVDRIVVLESDRAVVRWEVSRADAALARLRRVAREAACQCRRVWLPEVSGIVSFPALSSYAPAARAGTPGLAIAEPGGPPPGPSTTAIAVGPEGGWSPEELGAGWPTVGLSEHVLRAETAAVVAGALLCARRAGTVGPA